MEIFNQIVNYYRKLIGMEKPEGRLEDLTFGDLIKKARTPEDMALKPITQSATSATARKNNVCFSRYILPLRRYREYRG